MITFGRFGHKEDIQKDRELFLESLNNLIYELNSYKGKKDYKEMEIIKPLKEKINQRIKGEESFFATGVTYTFLTFFLQKMGLSYFKLTQKEKEEVIKIDFTYDNWKNKSIELINSFIERIKKACPDIAQFCFEDIYFIFHIQICYEYEFKLSNLTIYIRDYFIFNNTIDTLKEYRDSELYNDIQKKVIDQYPRIKAECGMNRILEKILSYITMDTDYNFEKTKKILDDYYNKKNKIKDEEAEGLKEKLD